MKMVRLQFDDKQYKITLPKAIVEAKAWKKGDRIIIKLDNKGDIILINERDIKKKR